MKLREELQQKIVPARPLCLIKSSARWNPDLKDGTVLHESGLVLSMVQLPMTDDVRRGVEGMRALDMTWASTGYPVWAVMADKAAVEDTLRAYKVRDEKSALILLGSLAREGSAAWLHALFEAEKTIARRRLAAEPEEAAALELQTVY